ncbi:MULTISPECIES: efflux RND transporter permease subunit [Alteromonas]|uniref:Acriflavine resistance protein B n=1 Tax=Alteromonas stellipolaris TaxID=233316 RepID=A0AAW7Z2X4_9ALTE|nr:efflux RND transporter permease subunit [Alteromonas stellipolaris]ALM91952.1 Acriflavin resistance protein [Alteromonas stellipolaris LMG 21856]AMJ73225.1 acriflavine resistance protein B [Alteromonas stellipolaris]ANB20110.1 acriflavine resistance protein B [Alteromonas stellipolaris]MDO6536441.1 efflux RND transporter permease subunit [Alteromonas stellipolaris]MDO6537348.1 efflux RND transporter permease subunit [Alteromonas stellipolaris]
MNSHKGIIAWFAQNSVAANLLMVGLIVLGMVSYGDIRKEAFPSMEPRFVSISMTYESGDAEQAEEGIAIKIENALETVPGIKRITSTSNANGANVQVEKETDYDLDVLFNDIKTEVDSISNLPSDAENAIIDKATRDEHVIWVQLYGDASHAELQYLGEQLERDLLAQDDIRDVSAASFIDPMMSIEIDEAKLQAYGLTLSDVASRINQESSTSLTTSLRNQEKVIRLKASEQAYYAGDFAKIPLVTSVDGAVLTVGDVAEVTDTFADDSYSLARYNGQNGYGLQVLMDKYGDVTDMVAQAHAVVDSWHERGLLPEGVQLETWYDRSTLITERLDLLTNNALMGIVLVFITLAVFLNLRVAFWVAAGLPFIFFGTLYFMTDSYTGMTLNEMTTFGFIMALGIVVDDAVVVGESVYSTRRRYGDTLANTIEGTRKVAVPTIFGVLTTVATFFALSNVSGGLGTLYSQFGTIVTLCLLLSVVESKLILPSHLAHLPTKKTTKKGIAGLWGKVQDGADNGLNWFNEKLYQPALSATIAYRYAAVLLFITLFIVVMSLPLTGVVRVGFFPSMQGDTVSANMSLYSDASFGQTERNLLRLENAALEADKQLVEEKGVSASGMKSLQVTASGDQSGTITISLSEDKPYTLDELAARWTALSGNLEAVKKLKIQARREMVDAFRVELKSIDDATLTAANTAFQDALENIDGVFGVESSLTPGEAMMRFELTPEGRAMGMDTQSLSQQLLKAFGGEIVQRYLRNKNEVKVRVRYPEEDRMDPSDVMNTRVRLDNGTVVPLSVIATMTPDVQQKQVVRIDGLRALTVSASVDSDVITATELVNYLNESFVPTISRQYQDLSLHFAGEAEQQEETQSSMESVFILALISIYALLAIPLKSYVQPLIIMTAIPFGIVGAVLGHWSNGLMLSILSLNGILALSGVVVNDSLLLVSRYNALKEAGMRVQEAVIEACSSRLRAVLLTSITTFLGLYPILGETSMQAQFLIPAAASLGYGILFATAITLVLIPALLLIYEDVAQLGKKTKDAAVQVAG